MHVGERIQLRMNELHISQNKLAKAAKISQSGLSSIISGASSPKESTLSAIATALDCSVAELMCETTSGFIPIIRNAVPVIGEIACGTPIYAEENIDGYVDLPDRVHADFALRCKGDSMEPTFKDGDYVLIRKQPVVENGQIAEITIGNEATLKHVYTFDDHITLTAENPIYPPITVPFGQDDIIIHGLAVGYTRVFY